MYVLCRSRPLLTEKIRNVRSTMLSKVATKGIVRSLWLYIHIVLSDLKRTPESQRKTERFLALPLEISDMSCYWRIC